MDNMTFNVHAFILKAQFMQRISNKNYKHVLDLSRS